MLRFTHPGLGADEEPPALSACRFECMQNKDTQGQWLAPCLDDCEVAYGAKGMALQITLGLVAGAALGVGVVAMVPAFRQSRVNYLFGAGGGLVAGAILGAVIPWRKISDQF